MSLIETIAQQTRDALKAGDSETAGTLRLITAQFQNTIKEKREGPDATLTDEEALRVVEREAKKRREAITLYKQGNREDLAAKEEKELALIQTFLPAQLTDEEVKAMIEQVIAGGATEFKDVMKAVSAQTRGRADGAKVAAFVKERVGQ
jgi:uncharacterized protein YqeY